MLADKLLKTHQPLALLLRLPPAPWSDSEPLTASDRKHLQPSEVTPPVSEFLSSCLQISLLSLSVLYGHSIYPDSAMHSTGENARLSLP